MTSSFLKVFLFLLAIPAISDASEMTAADAPSSPAPKSSSTDAPVKKHHGVASVDRIEGIGPYKFGAKLESFPPGTLQPVSPKAKGTLLRVTPYGDNYLVKDVKGLSWGEIPLAGMVVTFHDGKLIDLQAALKAKKGDFYVAERAFKEKYGPSTPRAFPLETWTGDTIQVSFVLNGPGAYSPESLDTPAQGKLELFDAGTWATYDTVQKAKLKEALEKRYETSVKAAKADL